jgi:hypothetical protein
MLMNLLERALNNGDLRIDREAGVIRGVKIIGPHSLNKRKYPPAVLQRARGFYEGRAVNIDHPDKPTGARSVNDRLGWLSNVRMVDSSLIGDLNLLKSDPRSARVFEAAERRPSLFGLSHNADGRVRRDGEGVVVEEIVGVKSVDLVCDPASTQSLFESTSATATATRPTTAKPKWHFGPDAERAVATAKKLLPKHVFYERQNQKKGLKR